MKTIYYNGDIITLENYNIEAILVENDIIKKAGDLHEVLALKDNETKMVDLDGNTMMPAFIDAHSHFSGVANNFLKINLEECKNFKDIQEKLREFKQENKIKDNAWILADGYDNNFLEEKIHPTKEIIDKVLPNNPVVLSHKSGHVGVFNSLGLKMLGIDNCFSGYMEENEFLDNLKKLPLPNMNDLLLSYKKAEEKYFSHGITTAQDGMAYSSMVPIYKKLIEDKMFKIDLVSYITPNDKQEFFESFSNNIRRYKNNFKIGGYKIFLDGSPQAKTAWMQEPYVDSPGYFGISNMSNTALEETFKNAIKDNMQLLAHCNGDKAAKQYLENIQKYEDKIRSLRPVMIHAQFLKNTQIDYLKKYSVIPSFFIAHTFYYGDIHIKNLGYERASKISPANSTLKKNIIFTFHQDSPVLEPNMFETIWCAIKRKTKAGVNLDEGERIDVYNAIKAVTINSAYQYFEENEKGSIKEGKFADLIIIDQNPLKIDFEEIRNIKILETIKKR